MHFGDGDHCQSHGSVAEHLCNPVALFAVHAGRGHWPTENKAYYGNTGVGGGEKQGTLGLRQKYEVLKQS